MKRSNEPIRTWQRWSLALAIVGAVTCAAVTWKQPERLWRAYLTGYMACWPVAVGAAGLVALGNLTGGRWAEAARPLYLAAARTMPLVAILFLPIALNVSHIYLWTGGTGAGEPTMPPSKAAYLEPTFFLVRAAGYIAIWLVMAGLLGWVSRLSVPPGGTSRMRRIGALSLVLLVPAATFAAFDWAMSLEPAWYSSIYGAIVTAGGVLAAHALAICSLVATRETVGVVERIAAEEAGGHERVTAVSEWSHAPAAAAGESAIEERVAQLYNDLCNLLLAFLMVFVYFTFSQFLIIWSGNLPSEITWYLRRIGGGWLWLSLAMVLLEAIAFLALLARDVKRSPRLLLRAAILLIAVYGIHNYWTIVPAFAESGRAWQVANVGAIAALAGGWMAAFCWQASRSLAEFRSLRPVGQAS